MKRGREKVTKKVNGKDAKGDCTVGRQRKEKCSLARGVSIVNGSRGESENGGHYSSSSFSRIVLPEHAARGWGGQWVSGN